jgi:tetratricopeptide (TPR) repeat protein
MNPLRDEDTNTPDAKYSSYLPYSFFTLDRLAFIAAASIIVAAAVFFSWRMIDSPRLVMDSEVVTFRPAPFQVREQLHQFHVEVGTDYRSIIEESERLLEQFPNDFYITSAASEGYRKLWITEFDDTYLDRAEELILNAAQYNPQDWRLMHSYVWVVMSQQEFEKGIEFYKHILERYPGSARYSHLFLGILYDGKGDRQRAQEHLEASVEAGTHNLTALAHFYLARLAMVSGEDGPPDIERMRHHANRAIELGHISIDYHVSGGYCMLAESYILTGEYQEALRAAGQGLEYYPSSCNLHMTGDAYLGMFLHEHDSSLLDSAISYQEQAIAAAPRASPPAARLIQRW